MQPILAFKFLNILIILIAGFIFQPGPQSKMLYGHWVSDKPLFDNVLDISFDKNGRYVEITKNVKSNFVTAKVEAKFVIVNDSTLVITSSTAQNAHRLHFMKADLLRFYPVKRKPGTAIPPIDMYNFVRK